MVTDPQKSSQASIQPQKKEFHVTKNPTEVSTSDRKKQQAPVSVQKDKPKNSGEQPSHAPFKKAFTKEETRKDKQNILDQQSRSDRSSVPSVSLRDLKSPNNKDAATSSKNKGALQEVLAQALKESEKERQENSESHAQKIPEIPEQKLREILGNGDGK